MAKPFDVSKFKRSLTKSIDGLGVGFNDPTDWVSTGCYALNYLISGKFDGGIPLGKVSVFAGQSGCLPESATVNIRQYNRDDPNDYTEQLMTVGRLHNQYKLNKFDFEIDTPDGWQKITDWFDKGVLNMVSINVGQIHHTSCATNHLIECVSGENLVWIPAGELVIGDIVLTDGGFFPVTSICPAMEEECFDFTVDHPNHRYWGDGISSHNSGKSYICSGNIIKNAQEQGIYVVLIDTENALDETWLHALGVDTSEDKLLKLNMAMIDDVAKTISEFMKEYKALTDAPKVLFVIDSLGMLLTPTDIAQFDAGDLKGDLGRKPKALTALVRNCVNMFGSYNVGMVATNHTYAAMSQYEEDVISGGQGFIYASSIVISMQKFKLKEDEAGNKITEVRGIRSKCRVTKTRYNKPFEDIEIHIPWTVGMNPYSGLYDLFVKKGLLHKEGNRWAYTDLNGATHKYFLKEWAVNENNIFDLIMSEFDHQILKIEQNDNAVLDMPDEAASTHEIDHE